jgi:hypothetical protein
MRSVVDRNVVMWRVPVSVAIAVPYLPMSDVRNFKSGRIRIEGFRKRCDSNADVNTCRYRVLSALYHSFHHLPVYNWYSRSVTELNRMRKPVKVSHRSLAVQTSFRQLSDIVCGQEQVQ